MLSVHWFPSALPHISLQGAIPVKWDFNKRTRFGILLSNQGTACLSQWCQAENTILFEHMMLRYKCNLLEQNNFSPGSPDCMHFIKLSFCRAFFVFGSCSFAWVTSSSCCIGNSCHYLGLQRWIVPENSAINNLVGLGQLTAACSLRLASLHGCSCFCKRNAEAGVETRVRRTSRSCSSPFSSFPDDRLGLAIPRPRQWKLSLVSLFE